MKRLLLPVVIWAAACSNENSSTQHEKAQEIATAYLASKSMFDPQLRTTVDDTGEKWLVTYHIPEGATGGDQHVWVDKRTMKVVASVGSQ